MTKVVFEVSIIVDITMILSKLVKMIKLVIIRDTIVLVARMALRVRFSLIA